MYVIVSRSRLAGSSPTYQYRALVPLEEVATSRRARCVVIQALLGKERIAATRLSDVIAPESWFDRHLAVPCGDAARLGLVAKRIEALIIRTIYPEMTAQLPPLLFELDHEFAEASYRVQTLDLNASFGRFALVIDSLMASDLGLFQGCDRRAA